MIVVNGFQLHARPDGWHIMRRNGSVAAICTTLGSAEETARRFVPEDAEGRPLERYKAPSLWDRLRGRAGRWVKA